MSEKLDHITEDSIKMLVDQFYIKVRKDPDLKPIFERAIGTDDGQWQPHLDRMYDFWSSIMLASSRYHGTPMKKHNDLPPFDLSLFDRWLELFEETARDIHNEDVTAHYKDKSIRVAESIKIAIRRKSGKVV